MQEGQDVTEGQDATERQDAKEQPDLPRLKKGILTPGSHYPEESLSPERIKEINIVYAKDYRISNDLLIIARNFRKI